jgi:hypothetical protein
LIAILPASASSADANQGDQIGRMFVHWAIVFVGQFFQITEGAQMHAQLFSPRKKPCINFEKKLFWATFWAIFFTSSSGRPAANIAAKQL